MADESPELVFGLVGAIGTELEMVQRAMQTSLSNVGYDVVEVKISDLMREWTDMPERNDPDYYDKAMTAGNLIRENLKRPDAMAGLAIGFIQKFRELRLSEPIPNEKRAYVITSLKRAEELALLRSVYGASFFVISAYAPRGNRLERLASLLADRSYQNLTGDHRAKAESLIKRDEKEPDDYGQDVRKTYPLGDLFVNTSSVRRCEEEVWRFVSLIFGHQWYTPSRDEQGMAFAFMASLRSASPARQVGAALTDALGNLRAVGMNEVPSPIGGQYWEGDTSDGRDVFYGRYDRSDRMRSNLLSDVLDRLQKLGVLKEGSANKLAEKESQNFLRKAQLFDTIDYVRSVHAEASALMSAQGLSKGGVLYVTTFPCHECARHIVFAGINRVVYVESYPKSLVSELYQDSIAVDPRDLQAGKVNFIPFTGISPSVYQHLFSITDKRRKENDGKLVKWNASESKPRLHVSYSAWTTNIAETEVLACFEELRKGKGPKNGDIDGDA
jgi:cytidine deaminase